MNKAEIQIQFPRPGHWLEFKLTAVYPAADGYTRTDSYPAAEIPADQAPAMQDVVDALVGMGEDWQAAQVWARLAEFHIDAPTGTVEAVKLTVEAVHAETGGRRMFTVQDYPEFLITAPAAVVFFKHFTTKQ